MQEAVTWIESIPQYNGVHPMTTGEFAFCEDDEIRVDLLLLFIRENRVVQLSIDHAGISGPGLVALFGAAIHSKAIRTMEIKIHEDFAQIARDAFVSLMKQSKSIINYRLSVNFGDDFVAVILAALTNNGKVEELCLASNQIGLDGTRRISRFLSSNELPALVSFSLAFNPLGDSGIIALIEGLRGRTRIGRLLITYSKISDDGAVALVAFLANDSKLESLSLFGNEIKGAGMKALANALKHNQSMQHLNVDWNPGASEQGVKEAFIDVLVESNVSLIWLEGMKSSKIAALLLRNKLEIPAVVRSAALLLIGIRQSTDIEGMGNFAVFPKDIVRLIAQTVWATRREPIWIQALK